MELKFANWLLSENYNYLQEFRISLSSLVNTFELNDWNVFIENKLKRIANNEKLMKLFDSDVFIKRLSNAVEYVTRTYSMDRTGFVSSIEILNLPVKFNIVKELLSPFGFSKLLDQVYNKMHDWALEKVGRMATVLHDIADIMDMPPLPKEIEDKFAKLIKDPNMWGIKAIDVNKVERYVDQMGPNTALTVLGMIAKNLPAIFRSGEYSVIEFLKQAENY